MKTLMILQLHKGKQKRTGSCKFECHLLQITMPSKQSGSGSVCHW